MRACAQGTLPASLRLVAHIDHCLGCQACEAVCPSQVPYARLLQDGRALLRAKTRPGLRARLARLLVRATNSPALVLWGYRLARIAQALGLLPLLGEPLATGLRDLPSRARVRPMRTTLTHGPAAALFTGCTADLDRETLNAALRLLAAVGEPVNLPPSQGCCGALARHAGWADIAARQEHRNREAFAGASAVITTASGCAAALRLADREGPFPPVFDIHRYLLAKTAIAEVRFRPWAGTIAVHSPCSLRNALRGAQDVPALLALIPEARIVPLAQSGCCGAAGDHFLREPARAQALADKTLAELATLKPDIVVSANIGCALHLAAALRRQGHDLPIVHPLLVLARQLPSPDGPC